MHIIKYALEKTSCKHKYFLLMINLLIIA